MLRFFWAVIGEKEYKYALSHQCCSQAPLLEREQRAQKRKMMNKTVSREPMQQGHYYNVKSQLTVWVETLSARKNSCDLESSNGPFGCIIYLFGCKHLPVLSKLRCEVILINAAAFRL
ncbi:hypothetical protein ILYODFUR_026941 [Ilyodon furcidens]|uniref:Uncharacterized protein n=1 Tax=Ilyodon furcidens TaxID=33524 RepID=A0ABV0TNM6_9TELE